MRTKLAAMSAALTLGMVAVACGSSQSPAPSPGTEPPATQVPGEATATAEPQTFRVAFSEKERVEDPGISDQELAELAGDNNQFAFDLYNKLAESEDGNLFMSPYSISLALAMTYAGARGQTAEEMADALNYTLPPEKLHAAFNELDHLLASHGAELEPDQKFTLEIANSIWGREGFEFEQPFLDTLAENYGAGMRIVDYERDAEGARLAINQWVEENTNERIKDLIPEGALSDDTVFVLANAIFFKAAWAYEFNPLLTHSSDFELMSGEKVSVDMMMKERRYRTGDGDGYRAVEIPYIGFETSMVAILPDEGEFTQFEQSLDAERLQQIIDGMETANLELQLPKFSFESDFALPEPLKALGMQQAFSAGAADFSGIHNPPNIVISDVFHKSFIAVDEEGTEAAASTAVIGELTSAPPPAEPLILDRPFIFLIRDVQTGSVLFAGRLMNPAT